MAPTNAVNLANFASGDTLTVDLANDRVGIGSTLPTVTLDVAGIVSGSLQRASGVWVHLWVALSLQPKNKLQMICF